MHDARMSPDRRFDRRVALVTGAANGIGRATAIRLAAEGATVVAFDVDGAGLAETVAQIEPYGRRPLAVRGDARRSAEVAAVVQQTVSAFGGLDVLANIAGVLRTGPLVECDEDEWDFVLETNAKGAFLFLKHAIPEMRKRGRGAIVNAASVLAFASLVENAAYAASKNAIVSLTRTAALEHAQDAIRVNCVAPGSVRTPLLHHAAAASGAPDPAAAMEQWGALHPVGRLIEPDEVAATVVFLLSDDAAAITGSTAFVDGGLLSKLAL